MKNHIEWLKRKASEAALRCDYDEQNICIDDLEKLWADDRAAAAFYTELERIALGNN